MLTETGQPVVLERVRTDMHGQVAKLQAELYEIRGETDVLNRDLKGRFGLNGGTVGWWLHLPPAASRQVPTDMAELMTRFVERVAPSGGIRHRAASQEPLRSCAASRTPRTPRRSFEPAGFR